MQFLYLFLSIYFGRKNPLYFLIFPFALSQGPGAFIDTRTVLIAPEVFLHGKNILKDIIIFYLIGVVIYLRNKININVAYRTPMKWLTIYVIFLISTTLIFYGTAYEAIAVIRLFVYMVLGYYLLILLFSSVKYNQFIDFFNILFWVNAIQSVLYVLNSSKVIHIFDASMLYREIESDSSMASFIRDFSTIPMFSNLLFTYGFISLILNEDVFNKKALYASLVTYPLVMLFTFTRSILFSVGLQVIIAFVILIKLKPTRIFRPYLIALFIGALIMFGIAKSNFSDEFGYFSERVEGAISERQDEENVNIRIQYHEKAWELLSTNNTIFFGNGLNKKLESDMGDVGAWSADSTIPFLLIFTGIAGVIIYYSVQIYFLFMCMGNSFYGINSLSITLFSILIVNLFSSLIMGGNSWGSPLFYWEFSLIVYIDYLSRAKINHFNHKEHFAYNNFTTSNIKNI